jgi:DNA-binding transcriptional LysR family regulator
VFDRTSRRLSLTPDGETLLVYANRLLALNDEAVRRLIAPPVRGHLRLGVADHFVPQHLAPILARFARIYPEMRLEVEVGRSHELRAACERGLLDLVIGKRRDGETTGTPIWTETLAWAATRDTKLAQWGADRPALTHSASTHSASPHSTSTHPAPLRLAMLPPGCMFRDRALAILSRANVAHEIVYTSASLLGVIAAAEAGLAVTVLGRSTLTAALREVPSLPPLGTTEMAIFGDAEGRSALVDPLVGFIRETLAATMAPRAAA